MSGEKKYANECGACGPAVVQTMSCSGEFGPEWDFAEPGYCGQCSFGGVIGTRGLCVHARYLGEPSKCCFGDAPSVNTTCGSEYTLGSKSCEQQYFARCRGAASVTDQKCVEWSRIRPDIADPVIQSFCVNNMNTPECQAFCRRAGTCDLAAQRYCETKPGDPFCACIKSPMVDPRYGINPKCNDRKCIDSGYLTSNMRATACPDITNCDIQAKLLNSGAMLSGVTINQNCGNAANAANTATASTSGTVSTSWFGMSSIVIVLVMLAIIVSAIAVYFLFFDDTPI